MEQTRHLEGKDLITRGKEVLLKVVALSIPTYAMNYFKFPDSLCKELEGMMARYWWGQKGEECKIHWLIWEKMCESKAEGGLGFKNFKSFILALLAKQGWKINQNEKFLLHRVYKSQYFPQTNFFDASLGPNPSYAWRGIWKAKKVLLNGRR